MIVELKILTNHVPEVSVKRDVSILCSVIRCKTHSDD